MASVNKRTVSHKLLVWASIGLWLLPSGPFEPPTALMAASLQSTFTVINTADAGPGSLRQAILDANGNPGLDTITFAISTPGSQQIISLTTALPAITSPVVLDGWSQGGGGYTGPPLIEINGSGIPTWNTSDGLLITAGASTVRGLAINYFDIALNLTTAGNNVIAGNYLGLALDGDTPIGNRTGIRITATSDNNRIGTDGDGVNDTAERNVISASGLVQQNNSTGILIDQGSDNHWIAGNFMGTDASGTQDRGNASNGITTGGVTIIGTNGDGIGDDVEGNLISGNNGHGVSLTGSSAGTIIAGNKIGTDVAGTTALPNNSNGVSVGPCSGGCSNYFIGTNGDRISDALEGNLISGNGADGVYIPSGTLSNTVIAGNKIGTNISGTASIPNDDYGVHLGGDFSRLGTNNDGVSDALEGNLISGNGDGAGNNNHGVLIPSGADHNLVAGNFIGTTADGTAALPNGQTGLRVEDDFNTLTRNLISGNGEYGLAFSNAFFNTATDNLIGTAADGITALGNTLNGIFITNNSDDNTIGAGNVIAFNGGNGIFVNGGTACGGAFCLRNHIFGNSIFDNAGLGIDLYPSGITPNDPLDLDTGANTLQNYPVLTTATSAGTTLIVTGTLNSSANLTFTIDVYSSSACDPGGSGEGAVYLGAGQATTDANGDAAFALSVAGLAQDGDAVTATATDPDGNTSEFSSCINNVGEEPITGLQAFNDSPTYLGLPTHLTATLSTGTGVVYAWDFGDGATGSGATSTHIYTMTGAFTATVTSANSLGSAVAATPITILPAPVCAATPDDGLTVFGSADATAVQQAVDSPQAAGGTVKIAGTCAGVAVRAGFTQTVYVEDSMTLAGGYTVGDWTTPNPESPSTLDALGQGRVIYALGAPLTLENLIIQNGNAIGEGGGLLTWGNAILSNVTFQNNQANSGGGAYVVGTLQALDSNWLNNTGITFQGGGMVLHSDAAITGGRVQGNAGLYGGGLFTDAGLVISGTQFISNTATSTVAGSGGAIYSSGPLVISNGLFEGNQSYTGGGAIVHSTGVLGEFLSITNTAFIHNTLLNASAQGGALNISSEATIIRSSLFEGNSAPGSGGAGGAIVAFKAITLTDTTLISNTAGGQGGAIYHWGLSEPGNTNQIYPLVIADSTLAGNQAGNEGGGLYFRQGWEAENMLIQLTNTTFEGNIAGLEGGGAYFGQPGTLSGVLFLENQSLTAEGGGLYTSDALTLTQTTFQGNTALGAGGAYVEGELTTTNTDWLDNTCTINEGGALEVYGDTTMTGGLVQGNACPQAGGIFSNGSLTIQSTHFISNTATDVSNGVGGAVYAIGSLTLMETVFQGNRANTAAGATYVDGSLLAVDSAWVANDCLGPGYNSGIVWVDGEASLTGGRMEANTCDFGSGVVAWAGLTISGTHFISNTAPSSSGATGGAVIAFGPLEVTNALFQGNRAFSLGGALIHLSSSDPLTITYSEFIDNATLSEGGSGGALATLGPTTILSSTFQANTVLWAGGAILANRAITLIETSLLSNTAGMQGGALYHVGWDEPGTGEVSPLVILNSMLAGNQAGGEGGGVYFYLGVAAQNVPIYFLQTTFQDNVAGLNGGGAFLPQPALVEDSTFRGNTSLNGAGGGLFASSQLILDNVVLTGNHAGINGGGLAVQSSGMAPGEIINSLFASNTTTTTGATLFVSGTRPLNIWHATLVGDTPSTHGIAVSGAHVAITNTIVVSHTTGILASGGAVVTADHVLFHNNRVDVQGVTNLNPVYGNPRFLDQPNGDFHLTRRSPAIDAGRATSLTQDFDGDLRPIITRSDIGADEFGAAAPVGGSQPTQLYVQPELGQVISITLPPGAAGGAGVIHLLPNTTPTRPVPPDRGYANLSFELQTGPGGLSAPAPATFLVPISIEIQYADADILGLDESALDLWVWDVDSPQWIRASDSCVSPTPTLRDPTVNRLVVSACAEGEFVLMSGPYQVYLPLAIRP